MGIGLSFGSKKDKGSSIQIENQTQDTTSNKSGTTAQTGSTQTSQESGSTSQGTSQTSQTGSTSSTGSSAQQTSQTQQQFSTGILAGLENQVAQLFSSNGKASSPGLDYLGGFDPNAFVASTLKAAQAKEGMGLSQVLGGIVDAVGGRNNSMTAQLSANANNDSAERLAGVQANATAAAQQMVQGNVATQTAANSGVQGFLAQMLNALKGGVSTATGATTQQTAEQQQTAQESGTATSEDQQTSSTTAETQQMLQQLTELLSGSTTTAGQSNTWTTGKSTGMGASFSG